MRGEALLLYDGECRLCQRTVKLIQAWDRGGRIACLPYQDPIVPGLLPDLSRAELERAIVLLGPRGRRYHGAEALPRIASLLPGGFPLRVFFEVPGVPAIARLLYRWVAEHRRSLGCALRTETAA